MASILNLDTLCFLSTSRIRTFNMLTIRLQLRTEIKGLFVYITTLQWLCLGGLFELCIVRGMRRKNSRPFRGFSIAFSHRDCVKHKTHRKSRSNGQYSCLVSGKSRVKILARRPAALNDVFVDFLNHSMQILVQYV